MAQIDPRWVAAMKAGLEALKLNNTWIIINLSSGKKAIASKWEYKVKHKADGTLDKFKARLVANGYTKWMSIIYAYMVS